MQIDQFKEYMKQYVMGVEPKVVILVNAYIQKSNITTKKTKKRYGYLQLLYKEHLVFSNICDGDDIVTLNDLKKHKVVETKSCMNVMRNFNKKGIYLLNMKDTQSSIKYESSLRNTMIMFIVELLKLYSNMYVISLTNSPDAKRLDKSTKRVFKAGSFNCKKKTQNKMPIKKLITMMQGKTHNGVHMNKMISDYKKYNPFYKLAQADIDVGGLKFIYGDIE